MKRERGSWRLVEFGLAWLVGMCLLLSAGEGLAAINSAPLAAATAIATTTVTDTIYRADGTAAGGTVLISWPAFSTAGGSNVPAGSTSVTIGASGVLSVQLVANAGSTPMGSYYTVIYHLDDGTVTREYWVVPASVAGGSAVTVSAIRSTVLPTSVAMQTVSKSYVDTSIAAALTGHPLDSSPYVLKAGDTMTGPLGLPGDPVAPLQASDKQYVDEQVTALSAGLGQKVSTLPQNSQTVAQPVGTVLAVNNLNGAEYASQYVSGAGNNGIANATAGPDCASGCNVVAEQTYASTEVPVPLSWSNQTHLEDLRGGARVESFINPLTTAPGEEQAGATLNLYTTQPTAQVAAAAGSSQIGAAAMALTETALAGGNNTFPVEVEGTTPYFKTTYNALAMTGNNYTPGQHVLSSEAQNCYGVGDCLMRGDFMLSSGGFRDAGDEGAHPADLFFSEDPKVFTGTCASGCTTGATTLQVTTMAGPATQGEGRYLIDKNPAKVITTGTLIGGVVAGRQPSAQFAGTNFPVSVFLETAQVILSQANEIPPGTVTVPIVTAGVPAGFATNTAALPSTTGVACISDTTAQDERPLNFETAAYTVVDGSHVQLTLNRPHGNGATLAVGGLCGYGLEQTVDTNAGLRQVFPVIGSTSATSLLYAGGISSIVGIGASTSGYANQSLIVASITRTGGVVTVTLANNLLADVNALTLTVSGVSDTSYNGSYLVTTTGPNTLTYANSGPDSTSAGGTLQLLTGGYALYPMAETETVYNATTKAVDGQFTLAANTVAWAAGDAVEQPHYFQQSVHGDTEFLTQFLPRPAETAATGIQYGGVTGAGLQGWLIENASPPSTYFGNGGTHVVPTYGMNVTGPWLYSIGVEAGEQAVVQVGCNSHGCDNWNSGYDLFQMQTSAGVDRLSYSPATSAMSVYLRGVPYTFTPTSFTAGTINVTTLTAGTVNGKFIGTVAPSSLPLFGASGTAHAPGAVPDPGTTGGTTRFLREDGTWAVAGGGSASVASSGGGSFSTTGPINFPQRGNLLGEYLMTEGTGSIVHDTSGNGNDGTISGAAWEGTADLSFSGGQFVQLPAALNAATAWQFALYLPPFGGGVAPQAPGVVGPGSFDHYPSILCGTDNAHLCILANSTLDSGWRTRFVAWSTDKTESAEALMPGWHVFTMLCGSNVNGVVTKTRYLYDGAEVGSYVQQGDVYTCPATPTSGNYQIGGSSLYANQSWFNGKVAAAWAWNTHLSMQDGVAAAKSALAYLRQKGVQTEFRPMVSATPQILAGIDSRTYGLSLAVGAAWPEQMQLTDTTYTTVNLGIISAQAEDVCTQFETLYGQYLSPTGAPTIAVLWGGINDLMQTAQTPRQIANSLRCLVVKAKAAGARVVLATEISADSPTIPAVDQNKDALDIILRAESYGWGVDNLADLATDPHLGPDGASANTSCFSDTIHPSSTCEPYITAIMQNAVNELLGATETNRHQTAAGSYQELAGDRFLDLTGNSAQTIALPVCTGYSLRREVMNLGASAAGVTAAGLVGPGSVNAGTRGVFVPVPGAPAVGGCHWQRVE